MIRIRKDKEVVQVIDDKVILKNGDVEHWSNGLLHRMAGPAIIRRNGTKLWFQHSMLHREDGPAVEYPSGHIEYWFKGCKYPNSNALANAVTAYIDRINMLIIKKSR